MAVLTSHLLSGLDGTHASGISVTLFQMKSTGRPDKIFSKITDQGGRFSAEFKAEANGQYELVVKIGDYFNTVKSEKSDTRVISDIVIRFVTNDSDGRYHIPIIISPNSYSCWWSCPSS